MHRNLIIKLLEDYALDYPSEEESTSRYQKFVKIHPNCFKRTLQIGHVTSSAWVISQDFQEVLLTHHRKLNIWIQLGGHVDGNPDVGKEALREVKEESGINSIKLMSDKLFDIDIHKIPEIGNEPEHYHYDARFLIQSNTRDYKISEESLDLAWVPIRNLELFTDETSMLRMRQKQADFLSRINQS